MPLLDTLRAYSRKEASSDEVLRAVLEHDTWQVPAELFARGRDPAVAPRIVIYGEQASIPPGALWIFSDDEHARRAAEKGRLGACAADLPGSEALQVLEGVTRIDVNPGSPVEETFFIEVDDGTRGYLSLWVAAVLLEQAAARGPLDDAKLLA